MAVCIHSKKFLILKVSLLYFGTFAFWADYIWYYHTLETRTVVMVNGEEPMSSFGAFTWFYWFDAINGAVMPHTCYMLYATVH
jgi:hypothetical protein